MRGNAFSNTLKNALKSSLFISGEVQLNHCSGLVVYFGGLMMMMFLSRVVSGKIDDENNYFGKEKNYATLLILLLNYQKHEFLCFLFTIFVNL